MSDLKKEFGKQVKKIRENKNITQEKLGEMVDLNSRSISLIECGINFVTAETLMKLSNALEVEPSQFFEFTCAGENKEELRKKINKFITENNDKLEKIYFIIKHLV